MSKIPYIDSNGPVSATVKLSHASDVFLVDSSNFRKYKSGQSFNYHGGHFTESPATVTAPRAGRWYLIVNGSPRYQYSFN
ncbi:DUF1883 domain-containing protein [Enterococcus casseliflavus]|uniref:DUF1883 domain-containing protein n=1 Tax=Enterococcus TaxID=1350 RepID=UPI00191A5BC0|nr:MULTISPECIES: DUF1883 domain-containing protein [Enterococcus]MDR3827713.1 DUF1883 domain-containing protein [Enterococcus sp.]QQU19798.1 DUF1883 domain-containing protein [Enterococcus casseliflavus]